LLKSLIQNMPPLTAFETAELLCGTCHACYPGPDIQRRQNGVEIQRRGYEYIDTKKLPLFQKSTESPQGNSRARVTWYDDGHRYAAEMAERLAYLGFRATGVWINPSQPSTPLNERAILNAILETRPDVVVGDKGIGYHDGLQLIGGFKKFGNTCCNVHWRT
jgi:hypothetical protein